MKYTLQHVRAGGRERRVRVRVGVQLGGRPRRARRRRRRAAAPRAAHARRHHAPRGTPLLIHITNY